VAILRDDGGPPTLLASLISSQIDLHRAYGGVVPEVASRNHALKLRPLVEEALHSAQLPINAIDVFAATRGPGLASSLLIGHTMAKALAAAADKPFLSINHMEGHLLSPFLGSKNLTPNSDLPCHLALIVSGGHTMLVKVGGLGDYRLLGRTIDDAAGEAFDKVARLLGLPYPGGPEIEKQARRGDPTSYDFPRSMPRDLDFSFSGLKTAVRYTLPKIDDLPSEIPNLCASFQRAVVEVLVEKAVRAAKDSGCPLVTLSGGVSCNQALRDALRDACHAAGLQCLTCPAAYSTDNAAMIAFAAALKHARGERTDFGEDIDPNLALVSPR
jgi:N6-L-threonylcarbamoyladenine synthase